MRADQKTLRIGFYALLTVLIVGVLFLVFNQVLPESVARRIGRNSEGYVLLLLAAGWIEFVRPKLAGTSREWAVTFGASAFCVAMGLFLLATDFPSRFRTLNETFLGAAVLLPYLQLRRPLPTRAVVGGVLALLAAIVVFNRTAVVTDLAETLVFLLLAPIGFDLIDKGILDPEAETSPPLRYTWYAALVVAPIVFSILEYQIGFSGLLGEATRYAVRPAEAFIFMLVIELYLAVVMGSTGRAEARVPSAQPPPARRTAVG